MYILALPPYLKNKEEGYFYLTIDVTIRDNNLDFIKFLNCYRNHRAKFENENSNMLKLLPTVISFCRTDGYSKCKKTSL